MKKHMRQMVITGIGILIACSLTLLVPQSLHAEENSMKVMETVSDDTTAKLYVRGAESDQASAALQYQIGTTEVSEVNGMNIADDPDPMRTIIMLDNSLSIPEEERNKISEIICRIVDGHAEGELFRIATYGGSIDYLSDQYSNDYTALKNMVGSVQYSKQSTYLTDVLYDEISKLNEEQYQGYTRFLIISDGVDENKTGISRDELEDQLRETTYPVYSIGVSSNENESLLKNMFALSRKTNADYLLLNDAEEEDAVKMLGQDNALLVVSAVIPDKCKNGETVNTQITIGDKKVSAMVQMPFGITKENSEEAVTKNVVGGSEEDNHPDTTEKASEDLETNKAVFLLVPIVILVIAVTLTLRKRKEKKQGKNNDDKDNTAQTEINGGETELVGDNDQDHSGIRPLFPEQNSRTAYRMTLTDRKNAAKTFQCGMDHSVSIGRNTGNNIVIDYDRSVSGKHCMISNNNGRFFVRDLGSSNKTLVNGKAVTAQTEIVSGDILKLGRVELSVRFDRI